MLVGHLSATRAWERADQDLLELFERTELSKYLTEPELSRLDAGGTSTQQGSADGSDRS